MTLDTLNLALRTLLTFVLISWSSIALSASETPRASFYISPAGSDSNSGRRAGEPFRTFEHAFRKLLAGDELILLDGVYSESAGTGHIGYVDANTVDASTTKVGGRKSAQIPSGLSATRPTYVRALNPGKVKIIGELFVGRSFRKDSHIVIRGITFEGGGTLYNANHITVRECGFHGPFGIGTNDHKQGNDYNLIEDVWIWASRERIIASIREAIESLQQLAAANDQAAEGEKGVNIVVRPRRLGEISPSVAPAVLAPPPAAAGSPGAEAPVATPARPAAEVPVVTAPESARITISLNQIPLGDALRYIANQAALKVKVEPHAVLLIPLTEQSEDLVTKTYQVPPEFFGGPLDVGYYLSAGAAGGQAPSSGAQTIQPAPVATGVVEREKLDYQSASGIGTGAAAASTSGATNEC